MGEKYSQIHEREKKKKKDSKWEEKSFISFLYWKK